PGEPDTPAKGPGISPGSAPEGDRTLGAAQVVHEAGALDARACEEPREAARGAAAAGGRAADDERHRVGNAGYGCAAVCREELVAVDRHVVGAARPGLARDRDVHRGIHRAV